MVGDWQEIMIPIGSMNAKALSHDSEIEVLSWSCITEDQTNVTWTLSDKRIPDVVFFVLVVGFDRDHPPLVTNLKEA